MEKPQRRNKNDVDFIMCSDPGTEQDTEVVNKVTVSDYRVVRAKITLNLKRTKTTLITRKQANFAVVFAKTDEIRIALKSKYAALGQEENEYIEKMNEDITKLITEAAIEVEGTSLRRHVKKLSESTKI